MAIKIKYKNPKSTDFGPNDIVINVKEGTIFYKSEKGVFKLQGDQLSTTEDINIFDNIVSKTISGSSISASMGHFGRKEPGIGSMRIGANLNNDIFEIGNLATLEVGGHILPSSSATPRYDLGSIEHPWRDIYFSPSSLHFVKTLKGIGGSKLGTTFIVGKYKAETVKESTTLTKNNIDDLKAGRSIISESKKITSKGQIAAIDGIKNYIRPEVIYHPTDDETAILHKASSVGRLSYRTPGGDPFDIHCDGGSNDTIRFGSTTTNATEIKLHGTISASIDGGSW